MDIQTMYQGLKSIVQVEGFFVVMSMTFAILLLVIWTFLRGTKEGSSSSDPKKNSTHTYCYGLCQPTANGTCSYCGADRCGPWKQP